MILAHAAPDATATPKTELLSGWTAAALLPLQYMRYVRREPDGTDSTLMATRRVCDCQPDTVITGVQDELSAISRHTALERRSTMTVCGRPAERLIVTGLAGRQNMPANSEVIAFRDLDALVILSYTFRYADPLADAERTLETLCPPQLV
jgi:hypothetical protein